MSSLGPDLVVEMDAGRHPRGKLGFLILSMEQTAEDDVFRMTPTGVGVHFARVPMSNGVSREALAEMAPHIGPACELLLPSARPDVLCYTCNAGTMVIGESEVMRLMRSKDSDSQVTTVLTGIVRALVALKAKSLAIITPYSEPINRILGEFIEGYGFQIADLKGMNIRNNSDIDRVTPSFIERYAKASKFENADAIVLCCGALRSLDVVAPLEAHTGKSVVCSNQAMMWDCLRLAGVEDRLDGFGSLFKLTGANHDVAIQQLACL